MVVLPVEPSAVPGEVVAATRRVEATRTSPRPTSAVVLGAVARPKSLVVADPPVVVAVGVWMEAGEIGGSPEAVLRVVVGLVAA